MNHTTNFALNQWEKEDRIQMEDFNADNAKIDAALTLLSNNITHTTYTGSGTSGVENPNTLTFERMPKLVYIFGTNASSLISEAILIPGAPSAMSLSGTNNNFISSFCLTTTWSENTVSWYCAVGNMYSQLNDADTTYHVIVLY